MVIIIIITKKHTIRCLFCLSLSLFSLRRLLYASYKNKKSSVATNFYLHCNIILCAPEGSKRGGGEEGRGKGREDGGEGYTQQVSSRTARSTYRAVLQMYYSTYKFKYIQWS